MKRLLLLLVSFCVAHIAFSQKEIVSDSIPKLYPDESARQLMMGKPLQIDESLSTNEFLFVGKPIFNQPLLPDYSKNLDFSKYLNFGKLITETYSFSPAGFTPFLHTANVFNQAAFRINDHFSIGGNSFGAQSVFDKPRLNPDIQDMSIKGASLFMEYKISKNVKVGTRVSISNHSNPWEP